jgi:hypothetical protein
MSGREKRFLLRFLAGEAVAGLGFAIIYSTFPTAPAVFTALGVVLSFLGAEVATFTVYACVISCGGSPCAGFSRCSGW